MKKLLILGAGTAGTMVANRLHRLLDMDEWQITMVDQNETHYYQPGFLFIPFGIYEEQDVVKPKRSVIHSDVELIVSPIDVIEADKNRVRLVKDRRVLFYDFLVIATSAQIRPDQTTGLREKEWHKSIHDFYTLDGALTLANQLRNWKGGRLVVNVVELVREEGIPNLNPEHWQVIDFCRTDGIQTGKAPTLRRITTQAHVSTKEMFTLFPKGPAKKVAKISGLGKTEGYV